ncbi:MAG: LPS export ABC transporter periplasmic protein LptC [Caulobacteraceae bacterium]
MTLVSDIPRPTAANVRAHSRLVRSLRVILPILVVAIAGGLLALAAGSAARREAGAPKETTTHIRMVNPHFLGRDSQGRAFEVRAAEAQRSDTNLQEVILRDVVLTLDINGAHPSRMTANEGVFREDTRILRLKGDVRVDDGRASNFATDEAIVDTRTSQVTGAGGMSTQTAQGNMQAGQYSVTDKGDRVILRGGVRARLNQH